MRTPARPLFRDKIAASKRKGLWVGGMAPLGYETKNRKIIVIEEEAERVRTIFRSYVKLGSLDRLMVDLRVHDGKRRPSAGDQLAKGLLSGEGSPEAHPSRNISMSPQVTTSLILVAPPLKGGAFS